MRSIASWMSWLEPARSAASSAMTSAVAYAFVSRWACAVRICSRWRKDQSANKSITSATVASRGSRSRVVIRIFVKKGTSDCGAAGCSPRQMPRVSRADQLARCFAARPCLSAGDRQGLRLRLQQEPRGDEAGRAVPEHDAVPVTYAAEQKERRIRTQLGEDVAIGGRRAAQPHALDAHTRPPSQ